jgi:hypothetical protein
VADYEYRTVTTVTHEWSVPVGPHGAPIAEIRKAITAAEKVYMETHAGAIPGYDHWLMFFPADDEIVMRLERFRTVTSVG